MSLLDIKELTHSFGDYVVLKAIDFKLNRGEHVGIVGQNGAGKSTFIQICTGQILPDKGQVVWHPGTTAGYLDQYAVLDKTINIEQFLKSAFESLYALEDKMNSCYQQAAGGAPGSLAVAARYQERLEQGDFYTIDTRINQVACGLGLDVIGLQRPVNEISGGQRAKVILAKLLLEKPEVLLLDEPTNFLDKEHIAWLADYLNGMKNAFMVVSHDSGFIEKVSTCICDIENGDLRKYTGKYSEFLKKKSLLRNDYLRRYTAQQKEIKKNEEFIRRNIAGRKTKMAQGRRKQLERMERMEALAVTEIIPDFSFSGPAVSRTEQLVVKKLAVGYDYPVLSGLNFSVAGGEKVVITGFNGIGKSTLLKTLNYQLKQFGGTFRFSDQAVCGYFDQELIWENKKLTPIQIIFEAHPALSERKVRSHLSKCGISSNHASQEISTLSGGEQAKVKLCLLTLNSYNFMILDEPTNHLDRQAKEALKKALMNFHGSILLVSHEEEFYREWAGRIINIVN